MKLPVSLYELSFLLTLINNLELALLQKQDHYKVSGKESSYFNTGRSCNALNKLTINGNENANHSNLFYCHVTLI